MDDLARIEELRKQWADKFAIDKSPKVYTDLGIEVAPIYTPPDIAEMDYLRDLGFPGEYPFIRGPYPEMSRHRPWRYALFTGFDTPEKTNERWKYLYKMGWMKKLMLKINEAGLSNKLVICGGAILKSDIPKLKELGVAEVFTTGTPMSKIAEFVQKAV